MNKNKFDITVVSSENNKYVIDVIERIPRGRVMLSLEKDKDWETIDEELKKILKNKIRYDNPIHLNYLEDIKTINPYLSDRFDFFTVSPNLPKGLILDEKTGSISGIPEEAILNETYEITGKNKTEKHSFCMALTIYKPIPKNLYYAVLPYYDIDDQILLEPCYDGFADSFFIGKELPEGLYFDRTTGVIRGSVKKPLSETYIITAMNIFGEDQYTLNLNVEDNYPEISFEKEEFYLSKSSFFTLIPFSNGSFYEVNPNLPEGLDINPNTGIISGKVLKYPIRCEEEKYVVRAFKEHRNKRYSKESFVYLRNDFEKDFNLFFSKKIIKKEVITDFLNKEGVSEVNPIFRPDGFSESYIFEYKKNNLEYILKITDSDLITYEEFKAEEDWLNYLNDKKISIVPIIRVIPLIDNYIATIYSKINFATIEIDLKNSDDLTKRYFILGRNTKYIHLSNKDFIPKIKKKNIFDKDIFNNIKDKNINLAWENIKSDLAKLEITSESYGMIHGDLSIYNTSWNPKNQELFIFDFEDCSLSWFIQDIVIFYNNLEEEITDISLKKKILDSFLDGYFGESSERYSWIDKYDLFTTLYYLEKYLVLLNNNVSSEEYLSKITNSRYYNE